METVKEAYDKIMNGETIVTSDSSLRSDMISVLSLLSYTFRCETTYTSSPKGSYATYTICLVNES